jgi:hypothetical protein
MLIDNPQTNSSEGLNTLSNGTFFLEGLPTFVDLLPEDIDHHLEHLLPEGIVPDKEDSDC